MNKIKITQNYPYQYPAYTSKNSTYNSSSMHPLDIKMQNMLPDWFLHGLNFLSGMETELFAAVTAGDTEKAKQLLTKETKETIDQVFSSNLNS